jgi:pyruvate, water dikinase
MIQIKGIGASSGKARGKVQIINDPESEFQEGNILVSKYTNPSLVPMMMNAKAIVTDKGGMICHAAIVSRELGIPCVVGTNNATDVLKDGMNVEVDGDKGIVYEV